MKINCKGFVLLETLIVAVFVVGIFTFLYTSVVPLLGTYDDLTEKENIDIIYKLYHLRKGLYQDTNYSNIINDAYGKIDCNSFTDKDYCSTLIQKEFLDLNDKGYELFYVKDIESLSTSINNVNGISKELKKYIKDYLKNYNNELKNVLFLHDQRTDGIVHLGLALDLNNPYDYMVVEVPR